MGPACRAGLVRLGKPELPGEKASPDGTKLASGGVDKIVRVWNVETGKPLFELARAGDGVAQVVFSPDGKTLAAASWDGLVWRWNIETGEDIGPLKAHTDKVTGVAFDPTGKFAATSCWDGTGAVWELTHMHVVAPSTARRIKFSAWCFWTKGSASRRRIATVSLKSGD